MDALRQTRPLNRDKSKRSEQAPRGAKQIVIPLDRPQYDEIWNFPDQVRRLLMDLYQTSPELFPEGFENGFELQGFGRSSRKMPDIKLRKIVLSNGSSYWLRPSFVMPYMTGTVEELSQPLLLAAHGVPMWLITDIFGHHEMYWQRLIERVGESNLVSTTVRDPARLPAHLTADEHHSDWRGEEAYIAVTAAEGCVLGISLTNAADDPHLEQAYGDFATEARELDAEYAPETVNTDGWTPTQNAFKSLFPDISVILCYLHGFLKIRDRCRKNHDLHGRVWDIYHALTASEFRSRMNELETWFKTQTCSASVGEMIKKLINKTEEYVVAYEHPDCRRTSNAVDRPMNRLRRLMYAGRGLHGHQSHSERRLRGWALLHNFRPFAPRSNQHREHTCPAHRLSGKCYHNNWLHNLAVSMSLLGRRKLAPAIR
jgi:hypothetical protein